MQIQPNLMLPYPRRPVKLPAVPGGAEEVFIGDTRRWRRVNSKILAGFLGPPA